MSAPKKIYTYMDGSIRTILHKNIEKYISVDALKTSGFTIPYILESEHERIVSELKAEIEKWKNHKKCESFLVFNDGKNINAYCSFCGKENKEMWAVDCNKH